MVHFIALYGKKRCGKSTLYKILRNYIYRHAPEYAVIRGSFASPLRRVLCELLPVSEEFAFDDAAKDKIVPHVLWEDLVPSLREKYKTKADCLRTGPMTWREILQLFGTDVIRNGWMMNAWARLPFETYKDYDKHIVIIDDARFPNELAACKENGGVNINIIRDTGQVDAHESENQDVPPGLFHFSIEAVDGVEPFTEQMMEFLKEHKKGVFPNVYFHN